MPAWWGWAPSLFGTAFCFVLGAAIGSFLNVVAYRVPKGEGLFSPPSRCPQCETKLKWRQNLPILGWLLLRGRCRFCRSRISGQYPLVEFITAALFAFMYAAWFGETGGTPWFHGALQPDWAVAGIGRMWPYLLVLYTVIAGLIAMTLIDARTFMIPLSIPWFVTLVAFVVHPLHAAWIGTAWRGEWVIPVPADMPGAWTALGGMLGVVACAFLLKIGAIPRSFADFDQWAAEAQRKEQEAAASGSTTPEITGGEAALGPLLMRVFYFTAPTVSLMAIGFMIGLRFGFPLEFTLAGTLIGLAIGVVVRRFAPGSSQIDDAEPEWIRYPHARREALKEVFCLLCIVAFAIAGWWIGSNLNGAPSPWVRALAGASLGYLVGGGLVWIVRILGSLAFGKEAMGMGDVHLLAAVGAALGWLDPVLAFFTAPFFGLAWVFAAAIFAKRKGVAMALPFGPHLAAGSIVVLIAWPIYERLLTAIIPATTGAP
jgi:prepilin signal peptidase PulO-like enzyme (type II secretory pathway)